MSKRHIPNTPSNTISDVQNLMSTKLFYTSDSTNIGYSINGSYFGTSPTGKNLTVYVELYDKTIVGGSLKIIDSFTISYTKKSFDTVVNFGMKFPPGDYKLCLRLTSTDLPGDTVAYPNRFLVSDLVAPVGKLPAPFFKISEVSETKILAVKATPNPFKSSTTIEFTMPTRSITEIMLYDENGKFMREELYSKFITEGEYKFDLKCANLPNGVYFLHLITEDKKVIHKVILAK